MGLTLAYVEVDVMEHLLATHLDMQIIDMQHTNSC
jgi:hypothetical protein